MEGGHDMEGVVGHAPFINPNVIQNKPTQHKNHCNLNDFEISFHYHKLSACIDKVSIKSHACIDEIKIKCVKVWSIVFEGLSTKLANYVLDYILKGETWAMGPPLHPTYQPFHVLCTNQQYLDFLKRYFNYLNFELI